MTRLAVVSRDECKPSDCGHECIKYCPVNRTGKDCIVLTDDNKGIHISETLCTGCGICIKKCPFKAIQIINLPEDLDSEITHRYGYNQFKLHRLPIPKRGKVVGLVGQNGAGKSTSINILSGQLIPNLGEFEDPPMWDTIIGNYKGNEIQNFFREISENKLKVSMKPQNIERLPKLVKGVVGDLLTNIDERGIVEQIKVEFSLDSVWDRQISQLSGGELQRLAIAATIVRDADAYFFDEPSSFLDISERMKVSQSIRDLVALDKYVVVVEHDLAILDYLSDSVHLYYGVPSAYGVVTYPLSVREGINVFLDGYIPSENMRFRDTPIKFQKTELSSNDAEGYDPLVTYGKMTKEFETFKMENESGSLYSGDIIGIVGPNGTGKTTFAKLIAGVLDPTVVESPVELKHKRIISEDDEIDDEAELELTISYKPQYLDDHYDEFTTVEQTLTEINQTAIHMSFYKTELLRPLGLENIMGRTLGNLSGGELQRVAIAECLLKEADLYLIDEPSAFISAEDRVVIAKAIRRLIRYRKATGFVIEHDLMLQSYISDRIINFDGEPGIWGKASKPLSVQDGMNLFLKGLGITFRGDPQTGRPRVNKKDSALDKQQKSNRNYYQLD